MKTKDLKFEEVEAEVVESDLELSEQQFAIDPENLNHLIKNVCLAANKALRSVEQLEVTDEALSQLEGSVAKNFATSLNADIKEVSEARKALKKACTQPVTDMEAKLKALMQPVTDLQARYKARQDEVEEQEKAAKMAALKAHYKDYAPFLALPLEGCSNPLVSFERIANPKWRNKTSQIKKCEEELEGIVDEIAEKQKIVEGMQFAYPQDAMAAFWAELDIEAAIKRDKELLQREEQAIALQQAQKAQQQAKRQEFDQTAVTIEELQGKPKSEHPKTYTITVTITETQKTVLIRTLQQLGIHGSMKEVR